MRKCAQPRVEISQRKPKRLNTRWWLVREFEAAPRCSLGTSIVVAAPRDCRNTSPMSWRRRRYAGSPDGPGCTIRQHRRGHVRAPPGYPLRATVLPSAHGAARSLSRGREISTLGRQIGPPRRKSELPESWSPQIFSSPRGFQSRNRRLLCTTDIYATMQ